MSISQFCKNFRLFCHFQVKSMLEFHISKEYRIWGLYEKRFPKSMEDPYILNPLHSLQIVPYVNMVFLIQVKFCIFSLLFYLQLHVCMLWPVHLMLLFSWLGIIKGIHLIVLSRMSQTGNVRSMYIYKLTGEVSVKYFELAAKKSTTILLIKGL